MIPLFKAIGGLARDYCKVILAVKYVGSSRLSGEQQRLTPDRASRAVTWRTGSTSELAPAFLHLLCPGGAAVIISFSGGPCLPLSCGGTWCVCTAYSLFIRGPGSSQRKQGGMCSNHGSFCVCVCVRERERARKRERETAGSYHLEVIFT